MMMPISLSLDRSSPSSDVLAQKKKIQKQLQPPFGTGTVVGKEEDEGRSRNAKAQARHRAKRKAYVEQLEATVARMQATMGGILPTEDHQRNHHSLQHESPSNGTPASALIVRIRELETQNALLLDENKDLRRRLSHYETPPPASGLTRPCNELELDTISSRRGATHSAGGAMLPHSSTNDNGFFMTGNGCPPRLPDNNQQMVYPSSRVPNEETANYPFEPSHLRVGAPFSQSAGAFQGYQAPPAAGSGGGGGSYHQHNLVISPASPASTTASGTASSTTHSSSSTTSSPQSSHSLLSLGRLGYPQQLPSFTQMKHEDEEEDNNSNLEYSTVTATARASPSIHHYGYNTSATPSPSYYDNINTQLWSSAYSNERRT